MPIVFIVVAIVVVLLAMIWDALTGGKKLKNKLSQTYGESEWQEPLTSSPHYYDSLEHDPLKEIDSQTWHDLNMSEFYKKANHTQSMIGEAYLYKVLHTLEDETTLQKREELVEYFHTHENERVEVQTLLFNIGKTEDIYLDALPQTLHQIPLKGAIIFKCFAYLPVLSLFTLILSINLGITLIFASLSINALLYLYADRYLSKVDYLLNLGGLMLKYGNKITDFLDPKHVYYEDLKKTYKQLHSIERSFKGSSLRINTVDITAALFIFKIFLLSQARCFFRVRDLIWQKQTAYTELYELLGEIEVAIAIASYRQSLDMYCLPEFSEERCYEVKNLIHPLLTNPVSNSINMQEDIMLTGSNASGKSTYIKAMGLNAITAQTIHTCFSEKCVLSPRLVVSSMAIQDNIINGESYFIAEIKSLKRMLDLLVQTPCFCLIDEILRGTNTLERISASIAILNYIKTTNTLCIVATHDLELTHHVPFVQYHFSEVIKDNQLLFDYLLKEGPCQSTNAIKLLEIYGFDAKILDTISLDVLK